VEYDDSQKRFDYSSPNFHRPPNPRSGSNKMNPKILGAQFDKQGRLIGCVHAVEGVHECPKCHYYGSCQ
jgi:hypothetical protein